ncbi:V-type ATP synthase subunit I [Stieleria neptunia]|uniref:V-type ATP synthase subunit I n=1 Tax=Stieleria neptunia TaxID=2527979 RepID=A0A518HMG6_9BACT|nr:V-type ATP synthase subunit I [Stieleria neptunia]QDV41999.1 V-type ATP synthase subunit I [Stieleria neptunia]
MAIVPLHRVTLIGELKDRDRVVLELQRLGCVHLVDLVNDGSKPQGTAIGAEDLKAAIAYLDSCPEKRPPPSRSTRRGSATTVSDHGDVTRIAAEVLRIESESRELVDEQEDVAENIEQTRPWGDFRLPAADELRGQQFFFYRLMHREARQVPDSVRANGCVSVVHTDAEHEYWVIIAEHPPADMPCDPEELDPRPLSQLQSRSAEIGEQRERLQVQRIALTRWLDRLRRELAAIEDETARMNAKQRSLVDGPMFALQGWAPRGKLAALETFARENTLALHQRAPEMDELPPTLLSNPRPIAGAEGAVTFFMTPGYRSWDPTWVMFFSFAAFFAMILADAGYGVVLGCLVALSARRLGRTAAGRQFLQLAVFMVAVTIVYGLLIGSFFGVSPAPGSWLDRLVIKSGDHSIMQDREAMMLISATIGVFHLVLANAVVAWRWLGSGHALSSVGWVVALIGGWLLTLTMLPKPDVMALLAETLGGESAAWSETVAAGGWWMLGVGLVLVFFFSSTRPVFSSRPRDLLARCLDGALGLTGVTKAFGDALSYLRLFALGLASAQLALLFNEMASDASQVPGVGILLGLLVFLLGHTLNFVLAVVGGVVHGLRLTCIEFFSWSLTDEGQPFQAFEMRANK